MTAFLNAGPDSTRNQQRWTHLSLFFLGLMVTVPFLHPIHHHPIPSFYGEWWSLFFGLSAAIAALMAAPLRLILPSIITLLAILLTAVALQWLSGMIAYREFALFHGGYLAWSAMLATLGATLAGKIGRDRLFQSLAAAIVMGALLSAGIAFAQRLHLPISHEIVFPLRGGRVVGNIAQANKLASYLWVGVVSVLFLREQGKLTAQSAMACVLLLGSAAGLTGSRMALLCGAGLMLATLAVYRVTTKKDSAYRLGYLGATMVALLCAKPLFSNLPTAGADTGPPPSALERMGASDISGDARLDLWRDTLTIIGDHPWAGNGVGNFPWRMVEAASQAPEGASTHPGAEHAHNIFLQIAADFGLPVMALFGAAIIVWLIRRLGTRLDGSAQYGLAVLTIWAIHSLFEYPLWYTDALGLFCLVMGAIDPRTSFVEFPARRPVLPVALAAGVLALMPLKLDYERLDDATNRRPAVPSAADWKQRIDTVAAIATNSGLGSYAYIALGSLLEPEQRLAHQQLYVCERTMQLWPDAVIIARCAYLRHLTGRTGEAQDLLDMARAAYRDPAKQAAMTAALELAAKKTPTQRPGFFWFAESRCPCR